MLTAALESITIVNRSTGATVDTLNAAGGWAGATYTASGVPASVSQAVAYYSAPSDGGSISVNFDQMGISLKLNDSYDDADLNGMKVVVGASGDKSFQIGADNATNNTIGFSLDSVSAAGLGISSSVLTSLLNARSTIDDIDTAIESINDMRSSLGATQNRLNFTISNLDNISQNLQASESTVRDTDFAQEMSNFTKNQILVQAGVAMLAQANAVPQNVLGLLG
jgi:flagellin